MPEMTHLPSQEIADFCVKWCVHEFSLFGSILRDDFGPSSDVDVLISRAPGARHSLRDYLGMREELKSIFGREVDLVMRSAIENSPNYIRRREILGSAKQIYAA